MASLRETLEDIISPKQNPHGDGAALKNQLLSQYFVNHQEIAQLRTALIADTGSFPEEFFNVEDGTLLIWDHIAQVFKNKVTGEEYFIRVFYDDFSVLAQSLLDWNFVDGSTVNVWEFGTDRVNLPFVNGMYISDDLGVTCAYTSSAPDAGVSHSTVDVSIPAGSKVKVKLKMFSTGEPGFDDLRVFAYNTPTVPVSDVPQALADQKLLITGEASHSDFEFELDNTFTGVTMSLSFQWKNDSTVTWGPPAHIQEVEILYK